MRMPIDTYKKLIKDFVNHYFSNKTDIDVFVEGINSYKIPGENKGTIFIVNLNTGEKLDEEEEYKLKEEFQLFYQNSKFQLIIRAPFSSTPKDRILLNFLD